MKRHLRSMLTAVVIAIALTGGVSCAKNDPMQSMKVVPSSDYASLIGFYRDYISPVDGERCTMYPGCSSYSAQAVDQYGAIKGGLMTFDRLIRCGRDGYLYPSIWIEGAELHLDEVKRNNDQLP